MTQFKIKEKQISVYPCDEPDRPVIYLNTFEGEGERVLQLLKDDGCPPFTLVSVSSLDWNHEKYAGLSVFFAGKQRGKTFFKILLTVF